MGEYGKYTVNELVEITSTDDEESMRTIATGWVNTDEVLNSAKEALKERMEQMRQVWTAPSFAAFETFINKTIAHVEAAQVQAKNRGDAAGLIASTAGWAKERVAEQYAEYANATLKAGASEIADSGKPNSFGPGAQPYYDDPTPAEIREPYDNQARKIMQVALEEYEEQKPPMTQEVVRFTPIHGPDGDDPSKDWFGGDDWGSSGYGGSNATDTAGLSAVSYGGNAVASQSPSLQSAGPTHIAPAPGGGVPTAPTGTGPTFNGPSIGGMPPGVANRTPTAPPKLPGPGAGPRNYLSPRTTGPATRTPGLPSQRSNSLRNGTNSTGRPIGNSGGKAPNRTGRGLQRSQMAPKDLTQRVRASNDVIGRRTSTTKPTSDTTKPKPAPRRVQPAVVRGAKSAAKSVTNKAPVDNTKRGYSSRVLNARNRVSEASGHSRTPYVAKKLKHEVKPEPFGKRQQPETGRSRARREIDAIREKRRKRAESDGLSRPVIGNGVTNTVDIHDAVPTQREAVKSAEPLWQPSQAVVSPVFGGQRWDPDAIDHDPGPKALDPRQELQKQLDARVSRSSDPGPKAFDPQRRSVDPWPQS